MIEPKVLLLGAVTGVLLESTDCERTAEVLPLLTGLLLDALTALQFPYAD